MAERHSGEYKCFDPSLAMCLILILIAWKAFIMAVKTEAQIILLTKRSET